MAEMMVDQSTETRHPSVAVADARYHEAVAAYRRAWRSGALSWFAMTIALNDLDVKYLASVPNAEAVAVCERAIAEAETLMSKESAS